MEESLSSGLGLSELRGYNNKWAMMIILMGVIITYIIIGIESIRFEHSLFFLQKVLKQYIIFNYYITYFEESFRLS